MQAKHTLTRDVDQLHTLIFELQSQVNVLKDQLSLMKHRLFGPKHESVDVNQIPLFESDEVQLVPVASQNEAVPKDTTRPLPEKRSALRVLRSLPVKVEIVDLPEHQQHCDCCGSSMADIGQDISRQIEYVPAQLYIKETHRKKYACRSCDLEIRRAPKPFQPIPKSMASSALLAHLIVSKFADHLPYYRLEKRLSRLGITLSRNTMSEWLMRSADALDAPYQSLKQAVLDRRHVFTDDTILPMQNTDPLRKTTLKSRIWVYATNDQRGPPITVYDFSTGRQQSAPHQFLEGFHGHLQADGYAGYQALYDSGQVTEVACWAHARRRFVDASRLVKTPGRAHEGVRWIRALYRIERRIKALSIKERFKARQQDSIPLLKAFHAWLLQQSASVLPKSPLGDAIFYALNRWDALTEYCNAGELEIDNNRAERFMRPIALGRKNYLFVGNETAGHAAAKLYSLVETCQVNGINPLAYLTDALSTPNPECPLAWREHQPHSYAL